MPPKDVLFPGHEMTFLLALAVISPTSQSSFDSGLDKSLKWKIVFNKH